MPLIGPRARSAILTPVTVTIAVAGLGAAAPAAPARQARPTSGGAPIGGLAPKRHPTPVATVKAKHVRGRWMSNVTITEYWPAPETWFVGRLISAPGLAGEHRIDWLYSAMGVSMEGQGIGLDGQMYHIDALGDGGWVTASGRSTAASNGWPGGNPYWRAGAYWRNRKGAVTFPLGLGGWSAGVGRTYVPLPTVTFAPGPSLPLSFYQSIAVDPRVIPLGSRVYIPAYQHDGHGGWFVAQDTGGAINGHRIDIYRSPPASSSDSGQYLTSQRVLVFKPSK